MDKNEYRVKLNEIKNLSRRGDYERAADSCDEINWGRVRNANTLVMVANIYEAAGRMDDCRRALLRAYDHAPMGRSIVYRLTELAARNGDIAEAERFYREFCEIAPDDSMRYELRYLISCIKKEPLEKRIQILEKLKGSYDFSEKWLYELAVNYAKADMRDKCVATCDELILWFGGGDFVKRALDLKRRYAPLTPAQEEKYKEIHRGEKSSRELHGETAKSAAEAAAAGAAAAGVDEAIFQATKFNTQNLQEELQKNMEQIMNATSKSDVDATMDSIKTMVGNVPYLSEPIKDKAMTNTSDINKQVDMDLQQNFRGLLDSEKTDKPAVDTSTMNIEDVLADWEKTKKAAETAMASAEQKKIEMSKQQALSEAGEIMDRLRTLMPILAARDGDPIPDVYHEGTPVMPPAQPQDPTENFPSLEISQAAMDKIQEEDKSEPVMEEPVMEEPVMAEPTMTEPEEPAQEQTPETQEILEASAEDESEDAPIPGQLTFAEMYREETPKQPEPQPAAEAEPETEPEPQPAAEAELKTEPEPQPVHTEQEQEQSVSQPEPQEMRQIEMPEEPKPLSENTLNFGLESALEAEMQREMSGDDDSERETPVQEDAPQKQEEAPAQEATAQGTAEPELSGNENVREMEKTKIMSDSQMLSTGNLESLLAADAFSDIKPAPEPTETGPVRAAEPMAFDEAVEDEAQKLEAAAEEAQAEASAAGQQESAQNAPTYQTEPMPQFEEQINTDLEDAMIEGHLDDEMAKLFSYYLPVPGMEEQIGNVLLGAKAHAGDSETSETGNIMIQGDAGSGKLSLAANLIKAMKTATGKPDAQMAKISASTLNNTDFGSIAPKVFGGFLIVDGAGELTYETQTRMSEIMCGNTGGMTIILVDTRAGIREAMSKNFDFAQKFTDIINIPVFTIDELVEFAKSYAAELECSIDEMAVMALCNCINNMQKTRNAVSFEDIKGIVDKAVEHAEGKGLRSLFGKKFDEDDFLILHEKDFEL